MSESIGDFKQSPEPQKQTEISPQEKYNNLLDRYTKYSQSMRDLYNSKRTGENADLDNAKLKEVDFKRHDIHNELNDLGNILKKSPEQVISDILFNEGNLREIGIDTPVIKLPILGTIFRFDKQNQKIKLWDDVCIPSQSLTTAEDNKIFSVYQARILDNKGSQNEEIYSGDKHEFDKWKEKPFYAIIFAVTRDDMASEFPFLYTTRLERMKNLARDYNLKCFSSSDLTGRHSGYSQCDLEGIEVSGEDLEKIGLAMKNYPEKYWLTEEELNDPYKEEFLEKESPSSLGMQARVVINLNSNIKNTWKNWYNFLRICNVLHEKYNQSVEGFFTEVNSSTRNFSKIIENSTKESSIKGSKIAKKMEILSEKIFPKNDSQ